MAYDVNEKRVNKILKIGRKYLTWVQNSLLEGEISEAKFTKLKLEIQKKAKKDEDTVCWYIMKEKKWLKKEKFGVEKGEPSFMID